MSEDLAKDMIEDMAEEVSHLEEVRVPSPSDPDWTKYVLDHLELHELEGGMPTTDGLRRVCELVFGEILESVSSVFVSDKGRAVVEHRLVIDKIHSGNIITVQAVSDAVYDFMPDHPARKHLPATACTKAEGKALRRAMKLRIHTAEETEANTDNMKMDDPSFSAPISDQQMMAITSLCERININLVALVKEEVKDAKSLREITNANGRSLIIRCSQLQREKIPSDLLGFDADWENNWS